LVIDLRVQKMSIMPSKLMSDDHSEPLLLSPPDPDAPVKVTTTKPPPSPKRRLWIWLAVLILVAAGVYYWWPKSSAGSTAAGSAKGAGKNGKGPAATPVVAAKAFTGNIGIYYTGLGAVTPLNTVTVKTRIDGQLLKVQYQEGQLVHQGDVLVEIDPRPYEVVLTQAQGQLAKDQATLDNARIDLTRYQTLVKQEAVPEQMATTQKATVEMDEGVVKSDQAQVDSAKLNLVYCHITAPITGRVGLRLVDQGNMVHAADTNGLLVITQIQPISVLFTIAEDQLQVVLKKIGAGQTLTAYAYDREMKNKLATGSLTTIDNQIDPTTGTLRLRATFPNEDNALFPNQFVNVKLLVQEKTGVILAPTAALQRNTNNTYVYVVKPDSTVTLRNVTTGASEGDNTEITSGLVQGDVVVLTGVDKLDEGTKVNVQIQGASTSAPAAVSTSTTAGAAKGQ
jgi:membrane fusion protein, multidrug efflux system